ncbi:hypothetical protein [Longimicrobium sp.]|uniref:hypothetical protein n=1 Tax=Longimicrobium sp. TaxID=2029185 RepID=UPI002C6FDF64|nr:hypothetical protein [Longimicrobium sp.]HSU15593.1 hypothetical protein [Longimicrobium sp.]
MAGAVTQPEYAARPGVAGGAGVTRRILSPHDQLPRAPLDGWVRRLRDALARIPAPGAPTRGDVGRLAVCASHAALVQVHAGRPDAARRTCLAALDSIAREARPGREELAVHAIQPWITLGRLDGLAGRVSEALARFLAMLEGGRRGTLAMAGVTVAGERLAADGTGMGELERLATNVAVLDGLKVLLSNGRDDAVEHYLGACRIAPGDPLATVAAEGRCVALAGRGHFREASRVAAAAADGAGEWNRAVLVFRAAEARLTADAWDHAARRSLERLGEVLGDVALDRCASVSALALTARAAALLRELGMDGAALARIALAGAGALGDEVLEMGCLEVLAESGARLDDGEPAADCLAARRATTRYERLRPPGTPARPFPGLDDLAAEIGEALAGS